MGVTLNNKVNIIVLNNVIEPRSALCATESVVYGLVNKNYSPGCPVVLLKVLDKPFTLCLDKIPVLSAVATRVEYDKVCYTVVVGVDTLICVLRYAGEIGVGNVSGYGAVKSSSTAVIGVIEVEVEIQRTVSPCIVVTHSSKHRNSRTIFTERFEVHIPHILGSAVFNYVTCVKYKRSVGKILKSFLVRRLRILKALLIDGSTAPSYTLSIAYSDKREITNDIGSSLEGIRLAPIVCLVGASLLTYLVLISSIGRKIVDIALEVVLIGGIVRLYLLDSIDLCPSSCSCFSVLECHTCTSKIRGLCGPCEVSCGLCLVKGGNKIVYVSIKSCVGGLCICKSIVVDTNRIVYSLDVLDSIAAVRISVYNATAEQCVISSSCNAAVGHSDLNGKHLLLGVDICLYLVCACAVGSLQALTAHSYAACGNRKDLGCTKLKIYLTITRVIDIGFVYYLISCCGENFGSSNGLVALNSKSEVVDLYRTVLATKYEIGHRSTFNLHISKLGLTSRSGYEHVTCSIGYACRNSASFPKERNVTIFIYKLALVKSNRSITCFYL